MAWFDFLLRTASAGAGGKPMPQASGATFSSLSDPNLLEYVRSGGVSVTVDQALKNSTVFRCVDILSGAIGALPLYIKRRADGGGVSEYREHPLFSLLLYRPNLWQTPFQFKSLMQMWALVHGNAYAVISRSGTRVVALNPVHPSRVTVSQNSDFSLRYRIGQADGRFVDVDAANVLHVRGPSDDGVTGLSRVKLAAEVIEANAKARLAASRAFDNGMMVGGNLKHPAKLSQEAYERLKDSMEARLAGVNNAGKWLITEEGMEATPFANTPKDTQLVEARAADVEEIGRIFGVPRPLLGVDDTSWGSGIEQLAILFVRFGLSPWFKAWEEAIQATCLTRAEWGIVFPDFDERELLRGTIKDQFDAYAKASGAGGHKPWMEANEIRDVLGMGPHPDGAGLRSAVEMSTAATPEVTQQ